MRVSVAAAGAALLSAGLLTAPASPAAAGPLDCPSGSAFCLFSHPSNPTIVRLLTGDFPRNKCVNVSQRGLPVDTYDNATGSVWVGYHKSNCQGGKTIRFQPGWQGGMLGTFGRDWADGKLHGVVRLANN